MGSGSIVTVNIRNIAVGGAGVGEVVCQSFGRTDLLGITAFVPFTAPGEVVSARVVQQKDRYLTADLVEIEQEAKTRTKPACRYYGVCGGCELQHMSYEAQLSAKREMIRGALRAARVSAEVVENVEALVADHPYGYRRRVSLHIDGTGRVGFYRANSRSVVPIEECPISAPLLEEYLRNIQKFGEAVKGKISSVLLEVDRNQVVAVLKTPYDLADSEQRAVMALAGKCFSNFALVAGDREIGGVGGQILELPLNSGETLTMRVPAGHFAQVNWGINMRLVEEAVRAVQGGRGKHVMDLYCGAGNFSLPLARVGARVTAVESDERLAAFARQNAERYGFSKSLNVVCSSVERFLAERAAEMAVDSIIADPPRSGLGPLAVRLPKVQRLVLIFCHLPSFVRDIKVLSESGWRVMGVKPFDMFPQTSYVEVLATLERC